MLLKLTLGLISPNFVCQVKICRQIQGMAKKCHSNSSTSLCQIYGLKLDKFLCRSPSTICHKRRQICKCKSLAQILAKSRLGWQQRKNVGRGHAPSFPSSSLFGFSPVFLNFCLCREKNRINFAAKIWTERKSLFNQRNSFITYTYDCINLNSSKSVTRYTVIIAKQHENSCEEKDYNFDGCRAQTWPTFMLHVLHLNFNICRCWSLYVFL